MVWLHGYGTTSHYCAGLGCHAILFAHTCATLRFEMKVIQVGEFTLETGDF